MALSNVAEPQESTVIRASSAARESVVMLSAVIVPAFSAISSANAAYSASVVTFPAYEETSVEARKAEVETERRKRRESWRAKMLTKLKGEQ